MLSDADLESLELALAPTMVGAHGGRNYRGDPAEIDRLSVVQNALRQRGRRNDAMTYAWLRSVLSERQGDRAQARAIIEEIRADLDYARQGTESLGLRASVTGAFAALSVRLAKLRWDENASLTARFDAIEWAKGRALADAQSRQIPSLDELSEVIAGTNTHYVTFLQDDHEAFAVFVGSRGDCFANRFELDRIEQVGSALNKIRARRPLTEWARRVEAVMSWLPAPGRGPIQAGDVVLISPHASLHSLALHALPTADGEPLAPRTAVVRVHGAAAVVAAVGQPAMRAERFAAVRAPFDSEDGRTEHASAFGDVVSAMREAIDGDTVEAGAADADAMWRALRSADILHIMSHGDFEPNGRFYTRSGVALAYEGRLPTRETAMRDGHLFAPRSLADRLRAEPGGGAGFLAGKHVTIQACVSGHARANPQGDAVGLEWAFLLGGAASVLSSHWHVELADAALFCAAFYRAWLRGRASRAEAWRQAVLHHQTVAPGRQGWAAFSLSGSWT